MHLHKTFAAQSFASDPSSLDKDLNACDQLLKKTAECFPEFEGATMSPILHGGSGRKFYRFIALNGSSIILVHYTGEREENAHYAACALFLRHHGIHVPQVIKHQSEEGLLWLQDLGQEDLWSHREDSWEKRRLLYESTFQQVALLHQIPQSEPMKAGLMLQKEFNEELYRWEQEYFLEHALGGLFGVGEKERERLFLSDSLQRLAVDLATQPRQLIHRDLQSQNVMLHQGEAWLIDFQGLRLGLAPYDVASLLFDPYVKLSSKERDYLLSFYQQLMNSAGIAFSFDFEKIFWQCAAQRLMQALGAYGFLSLHRGKPHFRHHVAPALVSLQEVLTKLYPENR